MTKQCDENMIVVSKCRLRSRHPTIEIFNGCRTMLVSQKNALANEDRSRMR
jgi:hypothetical protein